MHIATCCSPPGVALLQGQKCTAEQYYEPMAPTINILGIRHQQAEMPPFHRERSAHGAHPAWPVSTTWPLWAGTFQKCTRKPPGCALTIPLLSDSQGGLDWTSHRAPCVRSFPIPGIIPQLAHTIPLVDFGYHCLVSLPTIEEAAALNGSSSGFSGCSIFKQPNAAEGILMEAREKKGLPVPKRLHL